MLQETQLYWYKILFFFELAAAEGIFCLKLRRRSLFVPRLLLALAAGLAVAVLFPLRDYTVAYNSVIFFAIFFVTLPGLKFCFDESWWNILFCAVAGYSVQHIAFVAYTMVTTSLNLDGLLARPRHWRSRTSGLSTCRSSGRGIWWPSIWKTTTRTPTAPPGRACPPTTKADKSCHGFGLRSIRMTAEKYGGELSVHAKDHLFCLDVILPARTVSAPAPAPQSAAEAPTP